MTEQTAQERANQILFGIGVGVSAIVIIMWLVFVEIANVPKAQGIIWIPILSFVAGLARPWYVSWQGAITLSAGFVGLTLIAYSAHLGLGTGWYVCLAGIVCYHLGHTLLVKGHPKPKA
ncbi:MAG: hypothetical protein AAB424_01025 [Patescibacteria group bacterium]